MHPPHPLLISLRMRTVADTGSLTLITPGAAWGPGVIATTLIRTRILALLGEECKKSTGDARGSQDSLHHSYQCAARGRWMDIAHSR